MPWLAVIDRSRAHITGVANAIETESYLEVSISRVEVVRDRAKLFCSAGMIGVTQVTRFCKSNPSVAFVFLPQQLIVCTHKFLVLVCTAHIYFSIIPLFTEFRCVITKQWAGTYLQLHRPRDLSSHNVGVGPTVVKFLYLPSCTNIPDEVETHHSSCSERCRETLLTSLINEEGENSSRIVPIEISLRIQHRKWGKQVCLIAPCEIHTDSSLSFLGSIWIHNDPVPTQLPSGPEKEVSSWFLLFLPFKFRCYAGRSRALNPTSSKPQKSSAKRFSPKARFRWRCLVTW